MSAAWWPPELKVVCVHLMNLCYKLKLTDCSEEGSRQKALPLMQQPTEAKAPEGLGLHTQLSPSKSPWFPEETQVQLVFRQEITQCLQLSFQRSTTFYAAQLQS